jgi:hypothetical protein
VELLDFTLTERTTMTEERLPLNELLQKAGEGDFLRAVAESVLQLLMEADVEGLIGAGRHERAADRLNWRRYHDVPAARRPLFWRRTWSSFKQQTWPSWT